MATETAKSQIKSKDGLWASCYEFYLADTKKFPGNEWICSDFIAKLSKAAKKAPEGSELERCAALIAGLKTQSGAPVKIEATQEQLDEIEKKAAKHSAVIDKDPRRHGVYAYQHNKEQFERQKQQALALFRDELMPRKEQRWIRFPRGYDFQTDPGKAQKFASENIEKAIADSQAMMQISALLSKAIAQAKAQGVKFEKWEIPGKKPPKSVAQMAEAIEVPFNAVEIYSQRSCFAIYIERGENSGFESTRKDVKPDLGSARLFPDEPTAQRYAKARWRDVSSIAIVAVDIAPASFKPMAEGTSFGELQAVIAAKEALEIAAAIKSARIEALEAELAARKAAALDASAEAKPARPRL